MSPDARDEDVPQEETPRDDVPGRSADDLAPVEVDERFADIVAAFDEPGADPVPRWSVLEDSDEPLPPFEPPAREPLSARLLRRDPPPPPDPEDALFEPFVPEPPPPLPEVDRVTRLAWAGLVGGPALLFVASLLGIGGEAWVVVLALGAFVAGVGTLVARMGDGPDDGDDGAVV